MAGLSPLMGKGTLFHRHQGKFWLSSDPEQPGTGNFWTKAFLSSPAQSGGGGWGWGREGWFDFSPLIFFLSAKWRRNADLFTQTRACIHHDNLSPYLAHSAMKERLINDLYGSTYNYPPNVFTHLPFIFFVAFQLKRQQATYSCRTIDYYPNYSCLVFSTLLPFY